MLDVVAIAMLAILPVLTWSIWLVVRKRNYQLHKRIQLSLGSVLLVAVTLFEVDIRMYGWRHLAEPSPYYGGLLTPVLYVHLFFSIATTLLWIITIALALVKMPVPPRPCAHSKRHRLLGRLSAAGMYCTAITGWTFYWMAFVAS